MLQLKSELKKSFNKECLVKIFIWFGLLVIFTLSLSACKVTGANNAVSGCAADDQSCENALNSKPSNLFGLWVSANSILNGPMTYYKTLRISEDKIRFTQICSRQDGVAVTAQVIIDVKFQDTALDFGSGGEREEYRNGISCRIELEGGLWSYKLTKETGILDFKSQLSGEVLHFRRSTN